MKGFRPTGYGPSSGFKFPSKMGFTGSTGSVTPVAGYTRRKQFADGGFVRQDRMTSSMVGDSGSACVRRARSSTNVDQEYGGKSPLRPGFKDGGPTVKKFTKGSPLMQKPIARKPMKKAPPTSPAIGVKEKFYDRGGKVQKQPDYPKPSYWQAFKDRAKEMLTSEAKESTGMARKAADQLGGRAKQIDDASNYARGGKAMKRCARGGKMRNC